MSGAIDGEIRVPGSKSISNRAILIAALAKGTTVLDGVLDSKDTYYMIETWKKLGIHITRNQATLTIKGASGNLKECIEPIYVENAGTAARFLTAALNLGQGTYLLTGNKRMQERPILDLIRALSALGCDLDDIDGTGCPPVKIKAGGIEGGKVVIPGDKSSQYISAIMLSAPYASKNTQIQITGHLVSETYVEMTRAVMSHFGVHCDWMGNNTMQIKRNQCYKGRDYSIEGDASSASYFFGMAAITGGKVIVKGISQDSTQGDLGLLGILEKMGCKVNWQKDQVTLIGGPLKAVEVDMNSMSDVAPTLAIIALFADGITKITNIQNMRIKECDRIDAVTKELKKVGANVSQWEDGLAIEGFSYSNGAMLETYDDHRMAMSFSLLGLKIPDIRILNPDCVAKTFPDYFERFLTLVNN